MQSIDNAIIEKQKIFEKRIKSIFEIIISFLLIKIKNDEEIINKKKRERKKERNK